jgi:hypothetical protein
MHLARRNLVPLAIAGLFVAQSGVADAAGAWRVQQSPSPGTISNQLEGVAANSPADVWAVGGYGSLDGQGTLAEHFDGAAWRRVPTPNMTEDQNAFHAVSAVSATDVWAVGSWGRPLGDSTEFQPLIEHWDGHAWRIVDGATNGSQGNLTGVAAISADDVWAVGDSYSIRSGNGLLFEHWDGTSWTSVAAPTQNIVSDPGYRVSAVGPNDVWVVGLSYDEDADTDHPVFYHWDGISWEIVPGPEVDSGYHVRFALTAVASDDVWAAVNRISCVCDEAALVLEHWDGTAWSVAPNPPVKVSYYAQLAMASSSSDDIWVVGQVEGSGAGFSQHWDGTSWTTIRVGNGRSAQDLLGAGALPSRQVFAVGDAPGRSLASATLVITTRG